MMIETNDTDRRATVRWSDPAFGPTLMARRSPVPATAASCSARTTRRCSIRRRLRAARPNPDRAWPQGDAVEPPAPPPPEMAAALDALFADRPASTASDRVPERVLAERYSAFGAPRPCDAKLVDDQSDHLYADRSA